MDLPNIIVFIDESSSDGEFQINVSLVFEEDLEDIEKTQIVVATIHLYLEDNRGDMLLAGLFADTFESKDQDNSFANTIESCMREAFLVGTEYRQVLTDDGQRRLPLVSMS